MSDVKETLKQRGSRYGAFHENADYAQKIKEVFRSSPNWELMTPEQREGLELIASKFGRMLSGDPDYVDNWHDIGGYVKLIEDRIEERNKQKATEEANRKVDEYIQEISEEDHKKWCALRFPEYTEWFGQAEGPNATLSGVSVLVPSEVLGVHPQWPESEVDEVASEVFRPSYF